MKVIGNAELWQGDCLELMKDIPDGSVDMVLTDPPYGMSLKPQRVNGKFYGSTVKNDNGLEWADSFFSESYRTLSKEGSCIVFSNHFCIAEFITSAKKSGFEIKNLLVWDKKHFGIGRNWRPVHELILIATKGRFVTKSKSLKTIISISKVHHTKALHPTQKPIELMEQLISEPDNEPQIILDPFMGSGSTGVACMNTNRRFIGIELDKNYFDISTKRIEAARERQRLTNQQPASAGFFSSKKG